MSAQEENFTPPPPAPTFGVALPAEADEVADFIPPQATQLEVEAPEKSLVEASLSPSQDTAVSFSNTPLTVIVEEGTFKEGTTLQFTSLPVAAAEKAADLTAGEVKSHLVELSDNKTLYQFQIEAINGSKEVEFTQPVRLVLDLRSLAADLNPGYNQFYLAYQDEQDSTVWHEVPLNLHQGRGLISADVNHFSNWAAGVRPERWNPSWVPATVSEFSGAATYSYPIEVPPGRAGLQPSVALSYSSRGLDGRIRDGESGPIGDGWSIADISIVRSGVKLEFISGQPRNTHPDKFRLTLDGQGHELFPEFPADTSTAATMRYFAKDAPGLYIKRVYDAGLNTPDGIYWIVITPNGTKYRLGYKTEAQEHQEFAAAYWNISGHQGKPNNQKSAVAWHVDTITDVYGNQMTYSYVNWTNVEAIEWYESPNPYKFSSNLTTYASRIGTIAYNYPDRVTSLPAADTVPQLTSTPGSKIVFTTSSEHVFLINNIYVYHAGLSTPIKEYRINTEGHNITSSSCVSTSLGGVAPISHTRVVNSITVHTDIDNNPATVDYFPTTGTNGWSLPATTFEYESKPHYNNNCFYFYYLTKMKNGYGGEVNFTYSSDNRWVGTHWVESFKDGEVVVLQVQHWPVLGQSYYVTQMVTKDGRNANHKTTYEYTQPCYGQWSSSIPVGAVTCGANDAPEFGVITGFAETKARVYDFNQSTVLKSSHTYFSQEMENTGGRPMLQKSYDGNLATLLSETHTTYSTVSLGVDPRNNFTYVSKVENYQFDGVLSQSSKTTYSYDPTKQGGAQYGNVTDVWSYKTAADTTPYLKQVTYYTTNTSGNYWLVGLPISTATTDANDNHLNGSWIYYDGLNQDVAPTQGFVTRSRQNIKLGSCASLPVSDPNCVHAYQTIDSEFTKDVYGNLKTTTNYTGYGYRSLNSAYADSMDWKPTQISQPNFTQITTMTYETGYNLYPVKVSNTAGHETKFDIYGFLNSATPAVLVAVDGFQEQPGLLKMVTNADGTGTGYEYDPFGRLTHTFDGYNFSGFGDSTKWNGDPVVRYRYWDNAWNDTNLFLDPANNKPFFISDEKRPGTYPSPANSSGSYAFNNHTFFDGFGRPIQSRHIWADVYGQSNRREVYSTTAYNALGQTVCQTTPFDQPFYSDRGLTWPASAYITTPCTDASMSKTLTSYNKFGQPSVVTAPDGSISQSTSTLVNNVTVGSDSLLWRQQAIDANNHVVARYTNGLGQMVLVEEYTGDYPNPTLYAKTEYGYNLLGNLTTVTRKDHTGYQLSQNSVMWYDNFGRKTGMHDPDMGQWSYRYNAAGLLVEQRDLQAGGSSNDKVICMYYDNLNRLTSKSKTSNGAVCPTTAVTSGSNWLASYTFFSNGTGQLGKPSGITWNREGSSSMDWESYAYDSLGRLTSHSRVLNGQTFTMQYGAFDAFHRPTTTTYPDGEVVTTGFDLEGENQLHLSSVPGYIVNNVEYNHRGQMALLDRFSGGHDTLYTYYGATGTAGTGNSNFRLQKIDHDNSLLPEYSYEYDKVGNISSLVDSINGGVPIVFTYDELNRLTSASAYMLFSRSYGYDRLGNLTNNNGVVQNYNMPSLATILPHAVLSTSNGQTFDYDLTGNMTLRSDATGTYVQNFDIENRLTQVVEEDGQVTRFFYDAAGQRTRTLSPDGTNTYYPFPNFEKTIRNSGGIDVDTLNSGVACTDTSASEKPYTGTGYILYSEESVHTRFGNVNVSNANHFICVRYYNSQWQYDNDSTFITFTPRPNDLLMATFSYAAPGMMATYAGQSGTLNGVEYGYTGSNLTFQANTWNGVSDANEFYVTGTHFQTNSVARTISNLGLGVNCQDDATGNGYIMYSVESVHTRFATFAPNANNAHHFICVRHNGQSWQYDNGDEGSEAYFDFAPRRSDILVASVNFTNDTVTALNGSSGVVLGIQQGYVASGSNLAFAADLWNGTANDGEFRVTGTALRPNGVEVAVSSAGMGLDCHDTVTGDGYIMYSAERLQSRFTANMPSLLASEHFICVRYNSTSVAWEYNAGTAFVKFTPQSSDILVASVNFSTDTVTSLAGQTGSEREIAKGFASGLTFTADQWAGNANDGEFQVNGIYFTRYSTEEASKTYLLAGQPIAIRRTHKMNGSTVSSPLNFVYTDHLGSASTITDQAGLALVSDVRFDPFGQVRSGTMSGWSDRGFTGHQENRELGLTYMNARFYVPGIGRFASADTIIPDPTNPQAYNRYSYVYNNPILFDDPTGHCPSALTCAKKKLIKLVKPTPPKPVLIPVTSSSTGNPNAAGYYARNASTGMVGYVPTGVNNTPPTNPNQTYQINRNTGPSTYVPPTNPNQTYQINRNIGPSTYVPPTNPNPTYGAYGRTSTGTIGYIPTRTIGGNSDISIGNSNPNPIGGAQDISIGNSNPIGGNPNISIGDINPAHTIGGNQNMTIGNSNSIGGNQNITVGGSSTFNGGAGGGSWRHLVR